MTTYDEGFRAGVEAAAKEAEGICHYVFRNDECRIVLPGIKADIARRIRALSPSPAPDVAASARREARLREALQGARNYVDAVVANSGDGKRRTNYAGCVRRIDAALSYTGEEPARAIASEET